MPTEIKTEHFGRDWKSFARRIGPKLTLFLGILFLIEGIVRIFIFFLTSMIYPNTLYILICGILAISGVVLGLKGYKNAWFLCLIAGILAVAGVLIFNFILRFILQIFTIILPVGMLLFFINYGFSFILLIGGILCVMSEEGFLSYYKEPPENNPIQESKLNILFCPDCGKETLPSSKFCINCGRQFNGINKI
ncbi:MAG: zinc ribbon domain-containing protein [Promethearchaeota archaeon]|jgi:hypothetical protein